MRISSLEGMEVGGGSGGACGIAGIRGWSDHQEFV